MLCGINPHLAKKTILAPLRTSLNVVVDLSIQNAIKIDINQFIKWPGALRNGSLPSLTLPGVTVEILRARCATCSRLQLCLPTGLDTAGMDRLEQIIGRRRKVARGAMLLRIGDPLGMRSAPTANAGLSPAHIDAALPLTAQAQLVVPGVAVGNRRTCNPRR